MAIVKKIVGRTAWWSQAPASTTVFPAGYTLEELDANYELVSIRYANGDDVFEDLPVANIGGVPDGFGTSKFTDWEWSEGISGGGDTYIDFVITSATADNEIVSLESCFFEVDGVTQNSNYSLQSTNYANDTIRVVASSSEKVGTTKVLLWYNKSGVSVSGGTAATTTYDSSGESGGNLANDKTDLQAAVEEIREWANSPGKDLGVQSGAITLNETGSFDIETLSANKVLTFGDAVNHVDYCQQILYYKGNGVFTFDYTKNDASVIYSGFTRSGALAAGVMHRFVITYLKGLINIDYDSKTLDEVDTTAPTFVTASFEVGNIADNIVVLPVNENLDPGSVPAVGDFDIQVDASPNVVTNVDITTNPQQVRLTLTTSVTPGQTVTGAYTKGVNPLQDVAANETASLSATVVTNNVVASIIVMQDDFAGATIDTGKWTNTNPDSPYPNISQNNGLLFDSDITQPGSTFFANYIESNDSITSGGISAYFEATSVNFSSFTASLMIDSSNRATLASSSTGKMRAFVVIGGTTVHSFDPGTINAFGNRWKIEIENDNDINFYYYNTGTWNLFSTYNGNIGANKKAAFAISNSSTSASTQIKITEFYLTNASYINEIPS